MGNLTRALIRSLRQGARAPSKPRPRRFRDGEAGFTLVEVIVALAVLSIGIGVLFGTISASLRRSAAAARTAEASSLAQSLLARVGTEIPIRADEQSGELANGYRWTLKTSVYGDARERQEWPIGGYRVAAEVNWQEGGQARFYVIETLRLGPKAARP